MGNRVLVTGGAGYIGSHVVKLLGEAGHQPTTLDNLSKGRADAVLYGDLVVGDTGDSELVARVLRDYAIDTVMHFAAFTIVPESVSDPLKYYANNTCSTRSLLANCVFGQRLMRNHDSHERRFCCGDIWRLHYAAAQRQALVFFGA